MPPHMEVFSKPPSWRIFVRAKSRSFDFRLRATNVFPHWGNGGERIAIFLRLWRMVVDVRTENRAPVRRSKLLRFLRDIFRPRRWRRRAGGNNAGSEKALAARNVRSDFPKCNGGLESVKAIFSTISPHIGRNQIMCLIILVFVPFFASKPGIQRDVKFSSAVFQFLIGLSASISSSHHPKSSHSSLSRMILFKGIILALRQAPAWVPGMLLG